MGLLIGILCVAFFLFDLALLALVVRFGMLAARSRQGRPEPDSGRRPFACGSKPNCVSSEATDARHRVEPLPLPAGTAALDAVAAAVASLPGCRVVESSPGRLHAECRSRLFGFIDDLDLAIEAGRVHVRSASRVGHSDFGVNRRRVEQLRTRLAAADAGAGRDHPS